MRKTLWVLFFIFSISIFGAKTDNIQLTQDEAEWITANKNKNITIYLNREKGFLNYYLKDDPKGVFPDLIELLRKNTGLNFQIIDQDTDMFKKSINSGIPDIVMGVEDYKRNDKEYSYLEQPLSLDTMVITRKNYLFIHSKSEIFGKTIVCVKNNLIKDQIFQKYGDRVKLICKPTKQAAMDTLLFGEADIYIENYQDGLKYLMDNQDLEVKINYLSKEIMTNYYIGGKPEYRHLLNIIQKILKNMDLTISFFYNEFLKYSKATLIIPEKIKTYLEEKRSIKIFIPKSKNMPQLYTKDRYGNETGFLVNKMDEIKKILGLESVYELEYSSSGFDINPFILSVNGRDLNNQDLLTTEAYMEVRLLIFNREKAGYIPYLDELETKKIAVVKDSLIEMYLLDKGFKDNLVTYKTIKDAINSVQDGNTDALIGEIQEVNYNLKKHNLYDIKLAGTIPDKIELKFGVIPTDKILYIIIDSFNTSFSYGSGFNRKEYLMKDIYIPKDYKLSIIISLISILGFLGIYVHLKRFKKVHKNLKKLTIGLVDTLESANAYNDEDTGTHIKRLNKYSELLAKELNMSNSFVEEIGPYASLHDIGKIGISDEILKKPGKLTEKEFKIMKSHVDIEYHLIKDLNVSSIALNIVRYHHEKWDGMGYGKGLKGEKIPIEARIVALADVYDALRQERVYKKAFTHEKAMEIIISESCKHFDPKIVEVFIEKHNEFKKIFDEGEIEN